MVDLRKLMLNISLLIITFFLFMSIFGYLAIFAPDFLKIPFDNFLISIHFTNLNEFEIILLFFIISILFVFSDDINLNLKNRIIQNRIIKKIFIEYTFLSLFLLTLGFLIAFIASLLKDSFFMQTGARIFELGFLRILGGLYIRMLERQNLVITWMINFFVHHPYMRHAYVLMIFVVSGFLVYRLGIDNLKVSADNAYIAGITLFGTLTVGYMGYIGLVKKH